MAKNKLSRVITIRLTPKHKADELVLARLDAQKDLGFLYRETITNDVLKADGMTVDMFREKNAPITISNIEDVIEDTVGKLLEDMASYIIRNLVSDVRSGAINLDEGELTETKLTSYEQKMVATMKQRNQQKGAR